MTRLTCIWVWLGLHLFGNPPGGEGGGGAGVTFVSLNGRHGGFFFQRHNTPRWDARQIGEKKFLQATGI